MTNKELIWSISYMLLASVAAFLGSILSGCSGMPDPSGQEVQQYASQDMFMNVPGENLGLEPPKFNHGDTVSIKDGVQIGIVVSHQRWDLGSAEYIWVYNVMFQNSTIKYSEDYLELVEKFDWNKPVKQGIID